MGQERRVGVAEQAREQLDLTLEFLRSRPPTCIAIECLSNYTTLFMLLVSSLHLRYHAPCLQKLGVGGSLLLGRRKDALGLSRAFESLHSKNLKSQQLENRSALFDDRRWRIRTLDQDLRWMLPLNRKHQYRKQIGEHPWLPKSLRTSHYPICLPNNHPT